VSVPQASPKAPHSGDRPWHRWAALGGVGLAAAALLYWALSGGRPAVVEPTMPKFNSAPGETSPPAIEPEEPIPRVAFTDITAAAGIDFRHYNGAQGNLWMPEMMGSGCAFFDYDNDGHQDLLLINGCDFQESGPQRPSQPTSALYRNDGTGRFTNVTAGSGLEVPQYGMGVAVGDFDGDGLVDVFFANLGPNRLFKNLGEGKFQDVTAETGVAGDDDHWSTSCAWFDYDNDGHLDLFVCNYGRWHPALEQQIPFSARGKAGAAGLKNYLPPGGLAPVDCRLYRNEGNGEFRDVTEAAGINVRSVEGGAVVAQALGVRPFDYNNDGWIDLVVTNDLPPQFLFRNRGDGTFDEVGQVAGVAFDRIGRPIAGMGVDVGFVGLRNMPVVAVGNLSKLPNAMFVLHRDGKSFGDYADRLGVGEGSLPMTTFGLFFFDYDLDGRLDMFQTNGHIYTPEVAAFNDTEYRQPSQLFWKLPPGGRREFVLVPPGHSGEAIDRAILGRGAAYADIDGDGDLDILITENAGPPILLRNDQQLGHHWLRVKLRGRPPNTCAIGATVRLQLGSQERQQTVMPSRSYLSQVELPLTFGLGTSRQVDSLTIRWPDGTQQVVENPPVDRLLSIEQPLP
jgi:enediyne biosynthesis protein E4